MWLRALAATALLAVLGGCAVARLEPPRLQVMDVSLLGGDLLKQQLRLKLRVHNPNEVELPVRGITYEVFLVDNFSVSASHGIGFVSFEPVGGDSETSFTTIGRNFTTVGFHMYFLGGSQ